MIIWLIQSKWVNGDWTDECSGPTERESLARARYNLLLEEQADHCARNESATPIQYRLLRCEVVATTEE